MQGLLSNSRVKIHLLSQQKVWSRAYFTAYRVICRAYSVSQESKFTYWVFKKYGPGLLFLFLGYVKIGKKVGIKW